MNRLLSLAAAFACVLPAAPVAAQTLMLDTATLPSSTPANGFVGHLYCWDAAGNFQSCNFGLLTGNGLFHILDTPQYGETHLYLSQQLPPGHYAISVAGWSDGVMTSTAQFIITMTP